MATYTNVDLDTNPAPQFDGNDAENRVNFVADTPATITLAGATFVNWDSGTDFVVVDGSSRSVALDITGSSESDHITGGSGDDTINGFTTGDTVDGGDGTADELVLDATSSALNGADDADLVNVEIVTAAGAAAGVTIDLSGQSDGFEITGSDHADIITGSSGADDIDGGSGDDTINGFTTGDTVDGGVGTADELVLDATSSALNGADDADLVNVEMVTAAGAAAGVTIDLSGQSDGFEITGSDHADIITGSSGADDIDGGSGDDTINGFTTGDTVDGGVGTADELVLDATSSALNGADDADLVNVEIVTAAGAAAGVTIDLSGQSDGFEITGSDHADIITGSSGADDIDGGSGDDTINGFTTGDTVDGGVGTADELVLDATSSALNGADDADLVNVEIVTAAGAAAGVTIDLSGQSDGFEITGSDHADIITGSSGADDIDGGSGDDTINGFTTGDTVDGGTGTADELVLDATSSALNGADDADLVNVEIVTAAGAAAGVTIDLSGQSDGFEITGSDHADIITGSSGADDIDGGSGDDTINGFTTGDTVDGGVGTADELVLDATSSALNGADDADLVNVEIVTAAGAAAGVTIDLSGQSDGFEITGSDHADIITGSSGADDIDGGSGDDTINGFTTGDTVDGGTGTADELVLDATSSALNGADDADLVNVEMVTAAGAAAGVTIDLSGQSDGFEITGSDHADIITGSSGADDIDGGSGDDTINGFTTGDTVDGGVGTADELVLDATSSALNGADDADLVNVEMVTAAGAAAGVTIDLSGQSDGFEITGSDHADIITGSSGADDIDGGSGDDTINGFTTGDTVDGGVGTADELVLDATSSALNGADDADLVNVEIVTAAGAAAGVTIDLSGQSDGFEITGSDHADIITGSSGADDIDGGSGDDTINGFTTGDTVDGGVGTADELVLDATSSALNGADDADLVNVEMVTAAGAAAGVTIDLSGQSDGFEITGSDHADIITGSSGADDIDGGAGDDTINGFTTGDTVDGGAGTADTLALSKTSFALNAAGDAALTNVERVSAAGAASGVSIDLHLQTDGFEITGSDHVDTIAGSTGADVILAGLGNDTIVGFVGADKVDGGGGDDTLTLGATSAALNAAADADLVGVETVSAFGALAGVVIDLSSQSDGFFIVGGAFADTIVASFGDDRVQAGVGDDVVTGGAGTDVLFGEDGADRFAATNGDGNDVYDGGSGTDTVDYSATDAGVKIDLTPENRTGSSAAGDPGTFAALMAAGGFASASTPVGLASGGATGVDVLQGIENAIGSLGGDTIFGSDGANVLQGLAGIDKIWGRGGDDIIIGGSGDDVLVGDFGGGGSGAGNDELIGGTGDDQLFGEAGDDTLRGGAGSDQYAGGDGRDLLIFEKDHAGDTAWGGLARDTFSFEKGFGKDRIKDYLATGKDSDKIDLSSFKGLDFGKLKIKQKGSNTEITSKKFAKGDKIILEVVNAGALDKKDFKFSKKSKNKSMAPEAGDDAVLKGGKGHDKLKGSGHDDTLIGRGGNDKLIGRGGDDRLDGGKGDDKLIGGPGADTLTGGEGRDSFIFKSADDGIDTITDFKSGVDRLEISAKGFGGGLAAGEIATLVKLDDIAGHVDGATKGIFLFDTTGKDAGTIYWDATGGSTVDAVAIAKINGSILFDTDFKIA